MAGLSRPPAILVCAVLLDKHRPTCCQIVCSLITCLEYLCAVKTAKAESQWDLGVVPVRLPLLRATSSACIYDMTQFKSAAARL